MSEAPLGELLRQLHERLGSAPAVDLESRELLRTVLHDIEQALGPAEPGGSAAAARMNSPRLEALAVRFEVDHPGLAQLTRQLLDLLGKAGV